MNQDLIRPRLRLRFRPEKQKRSPTFCKVVRRRAQGPRLASGGRLRTDRAGQGRGARRKARGQPGVLPHRGAAAPHRAPQGVKLLRLNVGSSVRSLSPAAVAFHQRTAFAACVWWKCPASWLAFLPVLAVYDMLHLAAFFFFFFFVSSLLYNLVLNEHSLTFTTLSFPPGRDDSVGRHHHRRQVGDHRGRTRA